MVAVESQHSDVTRSRNLDGAALPVHDDDGMNARHLPPGVLVGRSVLEEALEPLCFAIGRQTRVLDVALPLVPAPVSYTHLTLPTM